MSNFPALYSSLNTRHLQEQADGGSFAENWSNVGHDLAVLTHVKGRRDCSTRGLEGASIVVIAWEP